MPKIANLCKPIHGVINYSTSVRPFESESLERKGKNTKNSISRQRKEFF